MSDVKVIAASIVNYLKQQLDNESFNIDARESLEVGIQCIETAFELSPQDAKLGVDLLSLFSKSKAGYSNEHAELLKNEGNDMMRADRCHEALVKYNRAIELDPNNSVYFCNRAAAYFKLGQLEEAVADCTAALALDPNYGKAYGRLGLALAGLDRHSEARVAYAKAVELDPNNDTYKQNLRIAEQRVAQAGGDSSMDFVAALQNPELMNMATQMLEDPNMRNMVQGLMNNTIQNRSNVGVSGVNAFLEIGQALARQMQATNPDLVERLRQQMEPAARENNPPNPPNNPSNPANDPQNPPNDPQNPPNNQ